MSALWYVDVSSYSVSNGAWHLDPCKFAKSFYKTKYHMNGLIKYVNEFTSIPVVSWWSSIVSQERISSLSESISIVLLDEWLPLFT